MPTQKSLIAPAHGIPALMTVKVLASGFYVRQDIKTPVIIGIVAMVANSIMCAFLVWSLAPTGLVEVGHLYRRAGTATDWLRLSANTRFF